MQSLLRRALSGGIAIAIVLSTIYAVEGHMDAQRLEEAVEQNIHAVAASYRSLAEEYVFPYENSRELTQDQRRYATRSRAAHSRLSEPLAMLEIVDAVTELQFALGSFLRVSEGSPLQDSLAMESLRSGMASSDIYGRLASYDESVRAWNAFQAGSYASLRGQLLGGNPAIRPYLGAG
jgi:hypothetical protein